jgi:hypothetical protein
MSFANRTNSQIEKNDIFDKPAWSERFPIKMFVRGKKYFTKKVLNLSSRKDQDYNNQSQEVYTLSYRKLHAAENKNFEFSF